MPVIASRLVGPIQLANADALLYTSTLSNAISGSTAMVTKIRHIHLSNPTGGAVTVFLSIGADGATTRIYDAYSLAAGAVLDTFVYYVLGAGETIRGHAGAATSVVVIIDGDQVVLG